ncbi:carbohydrate-binding family 9-like protein [Pontibacter liquoris]|uniref:carbohydrate-binding family 9-like protein n=1 Tax=Pontibacter liquoris TaxID=2905677 RepID=UPI001FA6FD93|nr:carbohydrate-binding family 9-like protein [Pontibacter liquoris]
MKILDIPRLPHLHVNSPLPQLTEVLDALPRHAIGSAPWAVTDPVAEAAFAVGHNEDCLFLKYFVREDAIQARYRQTNDTVYKDSCVEFFIALRGEQAYYNFEFNCLGTCRAGFGASRDGRALLPEHHLAHVRRWAALKVSSQETPKASWQLTLVIPPQVFAAHQLTSLLEEQVSVNLFKCGDELAEPHYLAWNSIEAPLPNFHLPAFFGEARFW